MSSIRRHQVFLILLLSCLLLPLLAAANTLQQSWHAPSALQDIDDATSLNRYLETHPLQTEVGGRPALPLFSLSYIIPAGERLVDVELTNLQVEVIELDAPLVAFAGLASDEDELIAMVNLSAAASFPAEHLQGSGTFFDRGIATAEPVLAPLRYEETAAGPRLLRLASCDIVMHTAADPGAMIPLRLPAGVQADSRARVAARIANPEHLLRFAPSTSLRQDRGVFQPRGLPSIEGSGVDMVIITGAEFAVQMQELADYKTSVGLATVVRDLDWIQANYPNGADLQETIRFFIQDAFVKWGISYVLLAGDTGVIPVRYVLSYFKDPPELLPSELYYGQLDGNWNADGDSYFGEATFGGIPGDEVDFVADVHVGRLPITTSDDADLLIEKILTYSESPDTSYTRNMSYYGEVLFPATWVRGDPIEWITRNGADYCEYIYNNYQLPRMEAVRYYETYELYPGSVLESGTVVLNDFNTRAHYAHHVGHGFRYTMSMGIGALSTGHIMNLSNGLDRLFNIYSLNCTSCAIDYNCIGEAFLLAPNGGAVTSIGTVRQAYPNTSVYYQNTYYETLFGDSLTVGECFTESHNHWANLAVVEGSHRWTQLELVLIGDPSLNLWLDTPYPLDVSLETPFDLDSETLDLAVTSQGAPVEGALVVATKAGEDRSLGYTDAGGMIALPFHAESTGDIEFSVVARNDLIYHGGLSVAAGSEARLSVDALAVRDNPAAAVDIDGNADGLLDAGETVRFALRVYNFGSAIASNVSLDLSEAAGKLNLLETHYDTGLAIAVGDSIDVELAFLAESPVDLADGMPVLLDFAISFTGGMQTDQLDLLNHAPVPALLTFHVDDSGGNGNGEPDAGETYTLVPEWKNYGRTSTAGWQGALTALDAGGTVLTGTTNLPALGLLETGTSTGFSIVESDVGSPNRFQLVLSGPFGGTVTDTVVVRRPTAPLSIALDSSIASDIIDMSWDIPGATAAGYLIYRSLASGGPYARISSDPTRHAYFRNSDLEESTTYYFVVETVDSSGYRSDLSMEYQISTNPAMMEGWPLQTGWGSASSLAVGDIDGDGLKEVVAASDFIYAWHHDGNEVLDGDQNSSTYGVLSNIGGNFTASVALAQIDTSTVGLEIVAASRDPYGIYVYYGDGSLVPGWPQSMPDWCWSTPAVADVDLDGLMEVFVVCLDGKMYAWNHDGSEVIDGDNNGSTHGVFATGLGGWSRSSPALGQLDADPYLEIVVGSAGSHKVYAWNHYGSAVPGWPVDLGAEIHSSPSLGDLDGDGELEVVILAENDNLFVLNANGSFYNNGFPVNLASNAAGLAPTVALVDLEDDGQMEIVAAGVVDYHNMNIVVLDNQGNALPGWPLHLIDSSEASPVVVDLDDDGAMEILLGSEEGYLYAFELDGSDMKGFPILTEAELRSSPTIDDVDGDYEVDVAVMGWDAYVYIWDMPARYRNGMAQWKMFRANAARTGVFTREDQIVGVDEQPTLPREGKLFANFPNPFNPQTEIRLATPAGSGTVPVTLSVHDLQGRRVATLYRGQLARGSAHGFIWKGRDDQGRPVASGIYFSRAAMGDQVYSQKMVLMK